MCCQPALSTALPSCVCACVSVWGVLLCVVRRLWDDLRAERCLPAQAPCLRIKAAREKLHKEVKEVLTRRHRSFPVFVFFFLSLVLCCRPLRNHLLFITDTNNRNMLLLRHGFSASFYFRSATVFCAFLKHISSFRCCQIAHESACVKRCVCIFCLQSTSWFLTVQC